MKTTVFMKVLKEVQNTELNPQLPIDGEQRSLCFTRLFRYAEPDRREQSVQRGAAVQVMARAVDE